MKNGLLFIFIFFSCNAFAQHDNVNKQKAIDFVNENYESLTALSDKIWAHEEVAFEERDEIKRPE